MKRFKKILKWTGIVLLVLITALSITVAARQNLKYDAPYPNIKASTDTAHCINCHYRGNADSLIDLDKDVPLTGGVEFELPVGNIYSKNITPDM